MRRTLKDLLRRRSPIVVASATVKLIGPAASLDGLGQTRPSADEQVRPAPGTNATT